MRKTVFLLSVLAVVRAHAGDPTDLVEKYEESRKEVAEAESQKRKILGSLYGINLRMKKLSSEKGSLTDELFHAQGSVKHIAKVVANLETQISLQQKQLRKRLRALYKLSGEGYLAIVFSRTDPQDLDRTMRFLKIVTDNDYRLIRSYQENIAKRLEQRKKMRGQVERLLTIEKNIKSKEHLLVAEHEAKSKIVSGLDREKIEHMSKMKSLRHQGQAMNLGDLLQPSIFEQKGQLVAPVSGELLQDFGLVAEDKYKLILSHKGWLLGAAPETPVASIFGGKVIFAESIRGYGPTVVVDHGDHYYSIYGHISRTAVKLGDTIKKGQVLADVGPLSSQQHGLYFEIRHFSEPENPGQWIRRAKENAIATNATGGTDAVPESD